MKCSQLQIAAIVAGLFDESHLQGVQPKRASIRESTLTTRQAKRRKQKRKQSKKSRR